MIPDRLTLILFNMMIVLPYKVRPIHNSAELDKQIMTLLSIKLKPTTMLYSIISHNDSKKPKSRMKREPASPGCSVSQRRSASTTTTTTTIPITSSSTTNTSSSSSATTEPNTSTGSNPQTHLPTPASVTETVLQHLVDAQQVLGAQGRRQDKNVSPIFQGQQEKARSKLSQAQ